MARLDESQSSLCDPQFRGEDDLTEDVIPDFSRVGYHYGDDDIPYYTNVVVTLTPPGDDSDALSMIQTAIDACDGKNPSVIILRGGTYRIDGTIRLNRSHVVLRGEKDAQGNLLTRLLATSVASYQDGDDSGRENEVATNLLVIGDSNGKTTSSLMAYDEIIEDYVPVGRMYVRASNASSYRPGDRVAIYRPSTQNWIHDIRMDDISDGENWIRSDFNLTFERIVTAVEGDRVYFDNPLVMSLDSRYGGGLLTRLNVIRIHESGVEDICFDSVYDISNPYDENHCSNAVKVNYAEHCWVRGIEGHHFIFSTVGLGTRCRNISVLDCSSHEPVSLIQGRRRYAFNTGPYASLGLFKNCKADHDRHQFVSTTRSCGPTVYTQCIATNCHSNTGPHCFWASGFLYDCIHQDGDLTVEDADSWGTGASQGWQGVNHVLWNCEADRIVCQSPWTAGQNWCVGCVGKKTYSTHNYVAGDSSKIRPDGKWYPDPGYGNSNTGHFVGTVYGVTTTVESLYESQLAARRASGIRALPLELYENL